MFVMICYDVPANRTDTYKRMLREFLVHEQASVFMGDVPESQFVKLTARIAARIIPEDRVLRLVASNRHNIKVHRLTKASGGGPMGEEPDTWHGKDWALV